MIGNIVYLYILRLPELLAVKQSIQEDRFVKIIEENKVPGGKAGEQYMTFKGQSLVNPNKVYEFNNYLSAFNHCSIKELEDNVKDLKAIILPKNYETIMNTIAKIKEVAKSEDK